MRRVIISLSLMMLVSVVAQAQILTSSNLPIVVIETDGGVSIPDEPKVPGTMKIIWHPDGSRNYLTDINNPAFLNYDGRIGIEKRGSTSQEFLEKKPYGLTTFQADDVTSNNVSILGMPEENDWVLNSLAFDQTGMRDVLAYELSESLGQYAPRRVYCEVMINGDYKGLYVFMEKIKVDKNRVNIVKMDEDCNSVPEVTGGYITKADKTTGGDPVAWQMQEYGSGWWPSYVDFIHHYPKPDDVTPAQNQYIRQVFFDLEQKAGQHNTSAENGIPSIIDVPSFIDFMMIAEYTSNVDVYSLSTFFHKDRNGKLRAGPVWDYNLAFGHDEFGYRSRYDVWQFDNEDNKGPRFFKDLFDTDQFRCLMSRRWEELTRRGQPLNYQLVCNRIDAIDALITEGVGRDNQRWHKMNSHQSYVQDMKEWLQMRTNWLNTHFGPYDACDELDLPPLVISKINYHPEDWWGVDGDHLEFIEITNNGDEEVDLTGVYFRELGVTYGFPVGSTLAAHDALVLCSDSLIFVEYYNMVPFGQFSRNLSNKSENLVLVDAWGNVIDQVHYYDSDPWPWEADGEGAYLELIDLDLDNSLPENWTVGYDVTTIPETEVSDGFRVFPNPTHGVITLETRRATSLPYRISNMLGQILMTGTIHGEMQQVNVSRLPSGMYSLTIGNKTKKLMVK
ncbi:MAG: CotH kinase family protein [Bacteroidales bacterium]|nr:CotH kinase family protein [Bacteroidales bacterium]